MKHNLKGSQVIRFLGTLLLTSVIMLLSVAASPAKTITSKSTSQVAISKYFAAQQNPNLTDEDKIKTAIAAYFTTRYEGQKLLTTQDFSPILEDNSLAWVQKEKDKREIELYNASLFDLKYQSYSYTLDYDTIDIRNKKATVQLHESHEVVFDAIAPEVSKLANLKHTITLHSKGGVWAIYQDEYEDELSQQLNHTTKANIKSQIDQNYQDQNLKTNESILVSPLAVNSYNRTNAINYAQTYYNYAHKNTAYFSMYSNDGYGGDCTNFVSQVIYAGAPKMNNTGNKSTGWWYNNKGTSSTADDTWSNSWSVVSNMYSFLTANTSSGPYGVSTTVCSMLPGDVVQLNNGSSWFHEVALHQKLNVTHNCSDLVNYTIIGHDTDRYNYPLTNYATYSLRYITIMGWRP